jgi:hypothetical protein
MAIWDKKKRVGQFFCLILSLLFLLSSCKGIAISGKTENIPGYTEAQAMVLVGSERNRIQNVMGKEVWDLPVEGQVEKTYGEYFLAKNKEFLQDIRTLNLMAEEKGIIANGTEMESIRAAANAFYQSLSEEDKAFFGNCSLKDVVDMYVAYFVAEKTAKSLLANVDTELSAAEAKVITVEQIVVQEESLAKELEEKVKLTGANFSYYARQYSEDPELQKNLAFGEREDEYAKVAFSLEDNEISSVFSQDGKYYILKCLSSYDEEATKERKERLEMAIRSLHFKESYEAYQKEHIVRFRESFWKEIDLHAHEGSTVDSFFSYYEDKVTTVK